jgi:hypothetical protein
VTYAEAAKPITSGESDSTTLPQVIRVDTLRKAVVLSAPPMESKEPFTQAVDSLRECLNSNLNEPYYDPPYGSQIEEQFARLLVKCLHPNGQLQKQSPVHTICGTFRLDFLASNDSMRVGFECDGQDFHHPIRDLWRDALILSRNSVDEIVRLRGTDIYREPEDCLFVLSRWFPELFNERWYANLGAAASYDARRQVANYLKAEKCTIDYSELRDEEDDTILRQASSIEIIRRSGLTKSSRPWWEAFATYARENGGGSLERVIRNYMEEISG